MSRLCRVFLLAIVVLGGCSKATESENGDDTGSNVDESAVVDADDELVDPDGIVGFEAISDDVTEDAGDVVTMPEVAQDTPGDVPQDLVDGGQDGAGEIDTGPPSAPSNFEWAEHWAPVFYHDTDADDYEADYIIAHDFDGDFVSDNNWANLHEPGADLSAVIYYAVVESETHIFITYAAFHPRDWGKNCDLPIFGGCHENDMEGAMVVVRKEGGPMGTFELVYTEAHNTLHIFRNDPKITSKSNMNVEQNGVTFEDESHPELYIESKGHGICSLYYDGFDHCKHPVQGNPPPFGGGDGVVYRYTGVAETPESGNDPDVGYALVSIETTLWARRDDICDSGCTYDTTFKYEGTTVPKAFDGDDYGKDKANPPWGWDDPFDGPVYRGDFFFRPAKTLDTHVHMPKPISQIYLYNPYLADLVP